MRGQWPGSRMLWAVLWGLLFSSCGGDALEFGKPELQPAAQAGQPLQAMAEHDSGEASALAVGAPYKAVSAGGFHSLALRADKKVWAWGRNDKGQLGNGTATGISNVPLLVSGLPPIKAIAAGTSHSLALGVDGTVWAWGDNASGQLGDGTTLQRTVPVPVAIPGGAMAISAGLSHSLAVGSDGKIYAWGANGSGQIGNGTTSTRQTTPVAISLPSSATAVSAGWFHSMALGSDGKVWTWGRNDRGQIGNGVASATNQLTPYEVSLTHAATAIAAGANHSLALLSNHSAVAWGMNTSGQIGNGVAASAQPVPVSVGLPGTLTSIAAGANHSLAIDSSGRAWAWGQNGQGRLGDGTTTQRNSPVPVTGLNDALALSGGAGHTLALRPGCPFWAWGDNASGQLGDGTTTPRFTLTQTQLLNIYFYDLDTDGYGGDLFLPEESCVSPGADYVENDLDCNDFDFTTNPGATEICDEFDNDCDTVVDEEAGDFFHHDADGDGYGDPADSIQACIQPADYVLDSSDCNDADASVNPAATEICDSKDNDCDGATDEGVLTTFYRDADGDGYGAAAGAVAACTLPVGHVTTAGDCNDADPSIKPGAAEICDGKDNDCDGATDEGLSVTYYRDEDGDGYGNPWVTAVACAPPTGYVSNSGDCNDADPSVKPGTTEACNGVDDNCSGVVDEGNPGGLVACSAGGLGVCDQGITYCTGGTIHCVPTMGPSSEICDGKDNDCDGATDEELPLSTFYRDFDGDTYGDALVSTLACSKPVDYVSNSTDCNDTNPSAYPGAPEVCNEADDNCDGSTDEGLGTYWYRDADGDGYGNTLESVVACSAPPGYVSIPGDCYDTNPSRHPGATEVCNGVDDNCNGSTDEGLDVTWYRDADGDTYGTASVSVVACAAPAGYVSRAGDCHDTDPSRHPGATEVCNGVDDNCNGSTDEGLPTSTWYRDADGDTYGTASVSVVACGAPAGYVSRAGDCNDSVAAVKPGATETCDRVDNNCNGSTDEGLPTSAWYLDSDGDGFGTPYASTWSCSAPAGYVSDSSDCNDSYAYVNPWASELCNGWDDNCNGSIDEGATGTFYRDADGDGYGNPSVSTQACSLPSGYVTNASDCNDASFSVRPGAAEVCDDVDNNCDGYNNEGLPHRYYHRDRDGDGYGPNSDVGPFPYGCAPPPGTVEIAGDCDDYNGSVKPGAAEVCDGVDNNCNYSTDEGNPGGGAACTVPGKYGACAEGVMMCSGGSVQCSQTTFPEPGDACGDWIDNDCDGSLDEGCHGCFRSGKDDSTNLCW
jgi:alpha-tubulin suppressor-like RCC1 family protein